MKTKINLIGNYDPDYNYDEWTEKFTELLEHDDRYICSTNISRYPDDGKFTVRSSLAQLKSSDIVVVDLSTMSSDYYLTGSIVEIYEAYKQNKAVYAFVYPDGLYRSPQANSPWVQQFITKEFNSMEDVADFLISLDNV